jgi:glycosyltransferase involved in cell wall biosynthesis
MSTASVSVVIPMHNSSSTIERALRSVFDQTLPAQEVIAVDDASTDDTCAVVERLATNSPTPIRLIRLTKNLGAGVTRNTGWDVAQGELIAFLDADDAWHPRKLEVQVEAMNVHPSTVMSCHRHRFSSTDEWTSVRAPRRHMVGLRAFLFKNRCSTPSVMVRRGVTKRFGDGSHSEDYLLWMRIVAAHGSCLKIDAPLVHCLNPAFGGGGLSGQVFAMERAELAGYRALRRDGAISLTMLVVASVWSIAKFMIRLARMANPLRRKQR